MTALPSNENHRYPPSRGRTLISHRKLVTIALLGLLLVSAWALGPLADSPPSGSNGFFTATLHPAFFDQNQSLPDDATPFLVRIGREMTTTIRYALVAMSLAVPTGLLLGFFASHAWWPRGISEKKALSPLRLALLSLHLVIRLIITLMRSIHELIWAICLLYALGPDPLTACIALALPFTGTLAKVFSELIDELPRAPLDHAIASGTSPLQAYLTTLFPQSFPDMATYTLYRFECALRSSAVLGFIGIQTIGLSIQKSFENNFYNELWTQLYLLIIVIISVDIIGAQLRKCLNTPPRHKTSSNTTPAPPLTAKKNLSAYLKKLKQQTPHWKLPRFILGITILLILLSWLPQCAGIDTSPLIKEQTTIHRSERFLHFIENITPAPVKTSGSWSDALPWVQQLWNSPGKEALLNTVTIATAAIILSAFTAWLLLPLASRNLASPRPLHSFNGTIKPFYSFIWHLFGLFTRFFFLTSRAIPEYILAYLLIGLLGISAWPLVLALAIHNMGILGRLWGEVMENQPTIGSKQILYLGGNRLLCYLHSYLPESFNRFLLYLFYRWETCIREATVLGILGGISLGYHIKIARSFSRAYDEMMFYVFLGAAVIFIGDILSVYLRKKLATT